MRLVAKAMNGTYISRSFHNPTPITYEQPLQLYSPLHSASDTCEIIQVRNDHAHKGRDLRGALYQPVVLSHASQPTRVVEI